MKASTVIPVLLLVLAAGPPSASARGGWALHADATIASDSIDRGYSRSPSRPSARVDSRLSHETGLVAGVSVGTMVFESSEYFPYSASGVESRSFVGFARSLTGDWGASLVFLHYGFPELIPGEDLSYEELELSVQFRELLSFTIAGSQDVFGEGLEARYYELSGRYPLPAGLDISVGAGYGSFSPASVLDYFYGNVGIARRFGRIEAELDLFLSDALPIPTWGGAIDERLVLSFSIPLFSIGRSTGSK